MGGAATREGILSASTRLFASKGYGNTTTSEIAHDAGVAEGTLYHHFDSKDEIFLTIFNETVDGYLAGAERLAGTGATGAEDLSALIRFHFDYLARHEKQFLIILRDVPAHMASGTSDSAAARKKRFGRLTAVLSRILSRGVSDGSMAVQHPLRDTAEMLRGILYGATRHKMMGIIDVPLVRLAKMLEEFCLNSLSAGPGAPKKPSEGHAR